jgi:hypothetical protein
MKDLKYTLIADGSSDKTLMQIIKWSLDDLFPQLPNEGSFADFRNIQNPPKNLKDKVKLVSIYYPFDILFIHRDAETTDLKRIEQRKIEISNELTYDYIKKIVCVIPIKMMETWLLFDIEAIKKAAGNRNYKGEINVPQIKNLEKEQQPKILLHDLLKEASGLKGRHLRNFNTDKAVHLVAENIEDFSPLKKLTAFNIFEQELKIVVDNFLNSK